jgi:predicted permease
MAFPGAAVIDLSGEVRMAVRSLIRRPGFALAGVLTLGLGIGAVTAIFGVADAVLFRPLPYEDPDRLATLWNTYDNWKNHEVLGPYWDRISLSWPEFVDWREGQGSFEEVGVYGTRSMVLTGGGNPEGTTVGYASASLFSLLGLQAHLGRTFSPEEVGAGARQVALLSYELWRDRYGEDPGLIGRPVILDGLPFEVVGVLRPGFRLPVLGPFERGAMGRQALWLPIGAPGSGLDRGNHAYEALGRLVPGVTLERAAQEARAMIWPGADPSDRGVRVVWRKDEEIGEASRPLLLLFGGVGLLLLIACGNLASLLIGNTLRRGRELATRAALGAGRVRILRQLALESSVLGLAASSLGAALAGGGVRVLLGLAPAGMALPATIPLDLRGLGFAAALGLASGLVSGLLPGVAGGGRHLASDLSARGGVSRRARHSQRILVAGQVAVSLVLLTAGALLVRSLARLTSVDVGFDAQDVVTARVSLPEARYATEEEGARLFHDVVDRLQAMPGTVGASAISAVPFSGRGGSSSFDLVDQELPGGGPGPEAHRRTVLPDYHRVMRIPLLEGRYLEPSDRIEDSPVILVSESMANRYWPGGSALGRRILRDRREFQIVGVVADVLHADLAADPLPTFYVPLDVAEERREMYLLVRSELATPLLAEAVRAAVWEIDPSLPVEGMATASTLIARSATDERFRTLLISAFALLATGLCAIGLFGVVARAVSARTSELGVRVALGARASTLMAGIVSREVPALAVGVGAGIVGALALGRVLSAFLFEISPRDPFSLGASVAVLVAVGLVAILAAARRALAVDPVDAIRTE